MATNDISQGIPGQRLSDASGATAGAADPVAMLSKDERSFLLYCETQCVDAGGLLEGIRMNEDDHEAAAKFKADGLIRFGRMPASFLGSALGPNRTHWVELTEAGWALAHACRRARATRRGPLATAVFADITERALAKAEA